MQLDLTLSHEPNGVDIAPEEISPSFDGRELEELEQVISLLEHNWKLPIREIHVSVDNDLWDSLADHAVSN